MLEIEDKSSVSSLYFDYEIVRNPNDLPRTDELHNFVSFITERLIRSGLVKVKNEANRNSDIGKSAV